MWWLAVVAVVYFFRGKIGALVGPYLPNLDPQKTVFYGHLITLVCAVIYIFPIELVGLGAFKRPVYLFSIWSVVCTAVFTIKANYGAPPIMTDNFSIKNWKASLQTMTMAMQPWLQKAMMGTDFHFLFFALIFVTANPSVFALLILGRRALWNVCTLCAKVDPPGRIFGMFAPTWAKLKAKEQQILLGSALGEILLGIYLAVSIALPSRQLLACFMYWNYLKTRFQVPRSHPVQLQAWQILEKQILPLTSRVAILNKPIDMAKNWFKPQYQSQ